MRIGIDARFYGPAGKGLGRYTQKLIENLEEIDKTNEYFIFLRKENLKTYTPANSNFQKVLADFRWYTLAEQLKMPRLLKKHKLDLVHFPHFNVPLFYRQKFIITIHDLILIHFPTIRGSALNPFFYWIKFLAYKLVINSALKRADKVIAVSKFTRDDILKNYRLESEKIFVTYEAADMPEKEDILNEDAVLEKYGIIRPYILYVGNAYPHKNLEALVWAVKKANEAGQGIKLVLVGREDYFYGRLKNFTLSAGIRDIIYADFIPDSDLDAVYRQAEAYIFPSLYEGFGLPPLEAMARAVPVLCSDHPSMKEILGDSALFFDAREPDKISAAILNFFADDKLRAELKRKGREQARKYSWKKMAEKTLGIYQEALNGRKY